MKKLLTICGLLLGLVSCYYDKEEILYPNTGNCDTTAVRYSVQVVQILDQYCMSCHSAAAASGGVALETYDQAKTWTMNGALMKAVRHKGPSPMPKNAPKLSDCQIATLNNWFEANCPNN